MEKFNPTKFKKLPKQVDTVLSWTGNHLSDISIFKKYNN